MIKIKLIITNLFNSNNQNKTLLESSWHKDLDKVTIIAKNNKLCSSVK
jgi:hypothetical protein